MTEEQHRLLDFAISVLNARATHFAEMQREAVANGWHAEAAHRAQFERDAKAASALIESLRMKAYP